MEKNVIIYTHIICGLVSSFYFILRLSGIAFRRAAEEDSKAKAAYAVKRAANTTQTKRITTVPAPQKSKLGPADNQKPLSRIRSQGKTRRFAVLQFVLISVPYLYILY